MKKFAITTNISDSSKAIDGAIVVEANNKEEALSKLQKSNPTLEIKLKDVYKYN